MQVNPWNKQIWVTNNGRDLMGDNTPPRPSIPSPIKATTAGPVVMLETFLILNSVRALMRVRAYRSRSSPCKPTLPVGINILPSNTKQFPEQYQNSLYIAIHGSWNRSVPTGYKVVRVPLKDGKVAGPAKDFATGWLQGNGSVTGRPAGVTVAPDGSLFVSDDTYHVIYHIWYR